MCVIFLVSVAAMGLEDVVKVIEHDFTAASVFTSMPAKGSVDIITMSYSYSMIPDQRAAMANATQLLKPGEGLLAIADFFLKGNYDDCLPSLSRNMRAIERMFHKYWFAMDHIHLLGEEQLSLGGPALEVIWDNRFRGGVPFLPFLQPYHGVYILKKV